MELPEANKPNFRRAIRYMLKKHPTDILVLFETQAAGDRASRICHRLGFEHSFRVDAEGQSGGIWLLWRSSVGDLAIVEAAEQFIQARITSGAEVLNVILVYVAPIVARRSGLWEKLSGIIEGLDEPVLIGGDFNTIVRLDEQSGGNGRLSSDSLAFGDWINNLSLIDLGFSGNQFTWKRRRTEGNFVAKRLDRVLCCPQLRLRWQDACVTHLPFLASDHTPLYVRLGPEVHREPRRRPFRFEAAWLKHHSFKELLAASWDGQLKTPEALALLQHKLKRWNKDIFGDIQQKKEALLREIKEIQNELELYQTDALLQKEADLLSSFDVVLEQEEVLWFQNFRERWITLGDRNTKYFHTSTVIRRRHNRIDMLRNEEGVWISNTDELENLAIEYYTRLGGVSPEHGTFQSSRSDGYQPVFYQDCWDVVGDSVIRFALEFFESGVLPPNTNDALVLLIAKRVIGKLIGPAQSNFIPGRLSTDNIVVVQEAVHSMHRKKGKKGWMLLKLDLEKAYDRIRWNFLEDTLRVAGLEDRWVQMILQCVKGPSMSILWNGERSTSFTPARGLRQGDTLSPYLFVLCMERLCQMIDISMAAKEW
ncbi:PREDICTED: uncharacterized protein LOC104709061 [Camelina sativa]|uniref:Uncharacterized protein LOC104709061 n=1 Tax=Camelina sativa TaxID=90675 RepID=A0ABM0TC73_CAMSA|nr:PREDICTED: uncharacterized protein LOC104709061 [Camelina sativa]